MKFKSFIIAMFAITTIPISIYFYRKNRKQTVNKTILDCIGNTPLIYLSTLSQALDCQIYCKLQYMNPFGSSKDRAVKHMIQQAQKQGYFRNKRQIVEASSGSTAISLIQICKKLKIIPTIFLTNDLSIDKYTYLEILGANIIKVPSVSIVDPKHFCNQAKQYAKLNGLLFLNQFDNQYNNQIHQNTTGPEIYKEMNGNIQAFICSAGTGGTIGGISQYLKNKNKNIKIILADIQGSGLYNKIKYNLLFTSQEKQGFRLKNPFDSVVEGIGLTRPTENFNTAKIDNAYKITDIQALHMSYYLIHNQGLFVGSSSAVNLSAVVKYSRKHPKSRIVSILHDGGNRYMNKFYNKQYLNEKGIHFMKKQQYNPNDLTFIL